MIRDVYDVHDHYWIVGGDESRAWSSRLRAYVETFDADIASRIGSEDELSDLLRRYGIVGPVIAIEDVKAEAQRRIIAITGAVDLQSCIIKQLNANMRANELNDKRISGETLTAEEESEAAYLRGLAESIKALRAKSDEIELMQPIPLDYDDDWYWQ